MSRRWASILAGWLVLGGMASASVAQTISTVAGTGAVGYAGDGGPATAASLFHPYGLAVDATGNLYIVDQYNHCIRKVVAATGVIATVAGNGSPGFSGDGGPASAASLQYPYGVAVDGAGNLFIADQQNHRIRRVDATTGTITTVAGNGNGTFGGDGGPAASASLYYPSGVAVDGAGNLYIADLYNHRIREVDGSTDVITTVVGNGSVGFCGDGGPAVSACLNNPGGVVVSRDGDLYLCDVSQRVRRVAAGTGLISTVAGNGEEGFGGDGGPATSAALNWPSGIALDGAGNLYIGDGRNNRIRRVDAGTGVITTVAGNGSAGFSGDGGPAIAASLNGPPGVAVDGAGSIYLSDFGNHRVRMVTASASGSSLTLEMIGDLTVAEGDSLTVLLGATEADGRELRYGVTGAPEGWVLSGSRFCWRPNYTQAAVYEVTFTVTDGNGQTYSRTVRLTVRNTNQAPRLEPIGDLTLAEGDSLTVPLRATDADGDELRYGVTGLPQGGVLSGSTFGWRPSDTQAAIYRMTFTVTDGHGGTDSETVRLTVTDADAGAVATLVDDATGEESPQTTALYGCYPNPFNPATTIRYRLAQEGDVRLRVYGVAGQLVRELVASTQVGGSYQVVWDGRDSAGWLVGNGVYLCELRTGSYKAVRRMALIR